jgi:hypothetical protein
MEAEAAARVGEEAESRSISAGEWVVTRRRKPRRVPAKTGRRMSKPILG